MAIQMRRGQYSAFDPASLLPGEWAVVLQGDEGAADGRSVYVCFAAGTVKRMATYEDMVANVAAATQDVAESLAEAFTEYVTAAASAASTAATNANTKASLADQKATLADQKATLADAAATNANDKATLAQQVLDDGIPLMSASTRGGAKLGDGLAVDDGALHVGSLVKQSTGEVYGPLSEVTAKGWAEQASTTGKNLCRYSTSKIDNGVTFTVNANGSVTANGTAADNANGQFSMRGIYLSAGIYTISGCPDGGGNTTWNVYPWDYTNNARPRNTTDTDSARTDFGSGASFLAVDGHEYGVMLRVQKGVTATNLTFYPQLEAGSTATAYEPYTGGAPSPSPDYPQEIRVARGRNLLSYPYHETTNTANGSTYTDNGDGSITLSGSTGTSSSHWFYIKHIADNFVLGRGVTYTLSWGASLPGNVRFEVALYHNGSFIGSEYGLFSTTSGASLTFTTPVGVDWETATVYIAVNKTTTATTLTTTTFYPQIELGSTPTPYVPYGHVGLEVRGRNLARLRTDDITKTSHVENGVTWRFDGDTVYASGTVPSGNNSWPKFIGESWTSLWDCGILPAGSYIATCNDQNASVRVGYGSGNNTTILVQKLAQASFTIAEPTRITVAPYLADGKSANGPLYIQLELGSTPHAYQPYCDSTTPIPLPSKGFAAALPDGTADELSIDAAGRWEWRNECAEVVFDGSSDETFELNNSGKRVITDLPNARPVSSTSEVSSAFSTHFIATTPASTWNGTLGFAINNANSRVSFSDGTGSMTIADFKSWLSTHPVTVLYPLATPTTEHDYINPPAITGNAVVSCPELESLGLRFWVDSDGSIHALADAYHARMLAEVAEATDEATEAVLGSVAPVEGATASTNYAQGSYLVTQGRLCKVTSAIATGEAITIGTNVTATTVAAEILAINS